MLHLNSNQLYMCIHNFVIASRIRKIDRLLPFIVTIEALRLHLFASVSGIILSSPSFSSFGCPDPPAHT